ncbi:MAG TPA: DUF371 domain-containing protein [Candidatus Bathyarchaeia archaeon]|nr:DUF371 domain-containing protein [Candidatus Bathyarchaeia archaeon]
MKEEVTASGHENIEATHPTTLEITKEKRLSRRGDCIIVVGADKSFADFSDEFKESLRKPNAKLTLTIEVNGIIEQINAHGSPNLILTHPSDMVVRKSTYVDNRTLAVNADKAASDLSREFVEKLRNQKQKARITLRVAY